MSTSLATMRVPQSVDEALSMIADKGVRVAIMSGGTHVMPQLSHGTRYYARVVDVASLAHFPTLRHVPEGLAIGPAVTYATLLEAPDSQVPALLRQLAGGITGGPQIRNQGTVGGSACYANPASDIPAALVCLGALMRVASLQRGERTIPAHAFFTGAFQTALFADELLTDIVIPFDSQTIRWGYVKLKTAESSWPVAVAAASLSASTDSFAQVTVTVGAAAEKPFTLRDIRLQNPKQLSSTEREEIQSAFSAAQVAWWTDELADGSYRRRVAGVIAARAIEDALTKERLDE